MLKALLNEAYLQLDITTLGPLLIKTGYATVIGADMAPVQTYRNGRQEIYLPGSSLKGVFRSHIEKVINSIRPLVACNPLSNTKDKKFGDTLYRPACGKNFDSKSTSAPEAYADSCPVCRLFGSTAYIGRVVIEDAYLTEGNDEEKKQIEHRDGIAIDRFTGGVSHSAKFDLETVTANTTFTTTIYMRNFEIWQLGMLFVIIQDLEDQLIRIGSGRSRGLGKVKGAISTQATDKYPGGMIINTIRTEMHSVEPADELWGLGHWLRRRGEAEAVYGTQESDLLKLGRPVTHTISGIRHRRIFQDGDLSMLKILSMNRFVEYIQQGQH